jgi:diketogulonate reductase-like aldo/keto reductase
MNQPSLTIDGVRIPRFIYGTAWKEDDTQRLIELAIEQGFRGIDTANQRRHYHEAAVGKAISASIDRGLVVRDELFLQSKYTFQRGQDHRLPYDPEVPIPIQVEQSLASSLRHLGTDHLDSFLLHGPQNSEGLTADDWAAWRAMEAIHDSGRVRIIGVSNVTLDQLRCLFEESRIRPRVVQNRCYAIQGWDRQVREFCAANGIVYQAFSLLTANRNTLASPELAQIAEHNDRTAAQIAFRFAIEVGMVPLTGTTNADHMRQDLDVFDFKLNEDEVKRIEGLESR